MTEFITAFVTCLFSARQISIPVLYHIQTLSQLELEYYRPYGIDQSEAHWKQLTVAVWCANAMQSKQV